MKKVLVRILVVALCSTFVPLSPLARATTLLYKNLDDLATEADAILIGVVTRTQSGYDSDGEIQTFVSLDVQQLLKGQTAHFAERDRSFRQSVTDVEMLHG
jgi:hypothetical protein